MCYMKYTIIYADFPVRRRWYERRKLTIVSKNLKLTKPIKDLVYKRSAKLKRKYFRDGEDYRINTILRVENNDHIADIVVYKNRKTFKKSHPCWTICMKASTKRLIYDRPGTFASIKKNCGIRKIRQRQEEREEDWSRL